MRFEVRIVFAGWRRSRWRSYRRLGRRCGLSWVSVLREGYAAERVYVICRGGDQAHYGFGGGEIVAGAGGGPGDVLGLASLLKGSQHKLSAVAIELSNVQSVRRAKFLGFMERHRDMSMNTAMAVALALEYEGAMLSARRLALFGSAAGKAGECSAGVGTDGAWRGGGAAGVCDAADA